MKEEFLHYIWRYKKFNTIDLVTVQGEKIILLDVGEYLQKSWPDFFNAKLIIGDQKWAGNIEIHSKSSDWYAHYHELDKTYENVILHVVWQHDMEVFRQDNSEIPVLELKNYVPEQIQVNYKALLRTKTWVNCEKELKNIDPFVLKKWQEQLFFERLEIKSVPIQKLMEETSNDWERVLFYSLAKNFGLNVNGELFLKMARSVPFSILKKENEAENLEAVFFGRLGLLNADREDFYFKDLKRRWEFMNHKYDLKKVHLDSVQFFQHRPDNFPTIRLAQLAQLYCRHKNLFSKITESYALKEIYGIFNVAVSEYWQTHYQFDKESTRKKKILSVAFIDLIVINTIVPIRFAYAKSLGIENTDILIDLLEQIALERNTIIDKFKFYGVKAGNAFDTQALLQLKKAYCNENRCLQCAIGISLLKE